MWKGRECSMEQAEQAELALLCRGATVLLGAVQNFRQR